MTKRKNKGKYAGAFKKYTQSLPALVMANILFAIPLFIFFALIILVENVATPIVPIRFLPIFLLMPFYCGLCKVTKDIASGKENVQGAKTFFKGLKDNFKFSVLHGLIFYIVSMIDFFSLVFYYQAGRTNGFMYIGFGLAVAITVVSVFCLFYVPIITVTLDIPFRYVYKNSLLMSIGELPKNFIALIACVACVAIVTTLFTFTGNYIGAYVSIIILMLFIVPATLSYVISAILYPSIESILIEKGDHIKNEPDPDKMSREDMLKKQLEENPIDPSILEGDENELVFYGGKMVKRSSLIEIYKTVNK